MLDVSNFIRLKKSVTATKETKTENNISKTILALCLVKNGILQNCSTKKGNFFQFVLFFFAFGLPFGERTRHIRFRIGFL